MGKSLNIDNVDQERLWKRIDMTLIRLDKENLHYIQSQQEYKEKSDEIIKILKEALGERRGFELFFYQDCAKIGLSAESLEAVYLQGYNDSLKSIKLTNPLKSVS